MASFKYLVGEALVSAWVWDDVLENKTNRTKIEVTPIHENGKYGLSSAKKLLYDDSNGYYFIWNKQRVYVKDFLFETASNLAARIKNKEGHVFSDDLFATLLKDENVGFVTELPHYDSALGKGLEFVDTLCVPVVGPFGKLNWHHKVQIEPQDPLARLSNRGCTYYTSDMLKLIEDGDIQLVDKHLWKVEQTSKT